MQKWQYKVFGCSADVDGQTINGWLNDAGIEGWELVSVTSYAVDIGDKKTEPYLKFFFKGAKN